MGVEGYDKVYTKVIEGKPKCVYKRPNGTKHYVLGFGKMRTIENYVKLCRKKAVEKAAKSKKVTKKPSTRKRYGGFFEELFTDNEDFTKNGEPPKKVPLDEKYVNGEGFAPHDIGVISQKTNGGNRCNSGGLEGGKRKKKNASNKSLLKMMMAAFKNKSVKKSKSKRRHRRGGGEEEE
jgi:hypothetical protein